MQEISIKTMINIKKILLSAAFVALGGISVLATSKRKEPATPAPSTIYWNDVYGKVYYSKNANVSPVVKIALNMFSDDMKAILGYPAKRNQMPTFRFTSSTCFPTRSFLPSRSLEFRSTSLSARKMHSGLVPVRAKSSSWEATPEEQPTASWNSPVWLAFHLGPTIIMWLHCRRSLSPLPQDLNPCRFQPQPTADSCSTTMHGWAERTRAVSAD